jgi:hypothetical protein
MSNTRNLGMTKIKISPFISLCLIIVLACHRGLAAPQPQTNQRIAESATRTSSPILVLLDQHKEPVITVHSRGAEDIKYGFEDGRVVKIAGAYHLITTEMFAEPFSVKTRIGYWTSSDRTHWTRVSTLFVSSGDQTGKDRRASLWGPLPAWNEKTGRWELFYVGYRSQPQTEPQWLLGYEGRIWRAVSQTKGPGGIGGPYKDVGVVLEPGPLSDPWEGLQGTDSFFPYPVGNIWYGMYGTAHTEKHPVTAWQVGLASAPDLAGPWKRVSQLNPLPIEPIFAENPIVTRLDDGTYMAVYDTTNDDHAIGYAWSGDGIHWGRGKTLIVQPEGPGRWAQKITTPLGLIPEGNNVFTVFYTGRVKPVPIYSESIGFVTVKLK